MCATRARLLAVQNMPRAASRRTLAPEWRSAVAPEIVHRGGERADDTRLAVDTVIAHRPASGYEHVAPRARGRREDERVERAPGRNAEQRRGAAVGDERVGARAFDEPPRGLAGRRSAGGDCGVESARGGRRRTCVRRGADIALAQHEALAVLHPAQFLECVARDVACKTRRSN